MGVLAKITSLFKKKLSKPQSNTSGMIRLDDLFYIPELNEVKNKTLKKLVTKYIEEYNKKISKIKNLLILDLSTQDIYNKVNMCNNIILNICTEDFTKIQILELPKIYIIEIAKLKYYRKIIIENNNEIFARLIAIKHILKTKFLTPSKRRTLKEFFNNLGISYAITANQNISIIEIINNYINHLKENENPILLTMRREKIYNIASIIIPDSYNDIIKRNIKEESKVVTLEILVEEYIYKNKDSLKIIDYSSIDSESALKQQEIILEALIYYGRNIITEEELEKFYEFKFNFLSKSYVQLYD